MRKITRAAGSLFAATALAAVIAPAAGASTTPARSSALRAPTAHSSAESYWKALAENNQHVTFASTGDSRSVAQADALAACEHSPRTDDPDSCHIVSTRFFGSGDYGDYYDNGGQYDGRRFHGDHRRGIPNGHRDDDAGPGHVGNPPHYGNPGGTGPGHVGNPGGPNNPPPHYGNPGGPNNPPHYGNPGGTNNPPPHYGNPGGTINPPHFGNPGGTGAPPPHFGNPGGTGTPGHVGPPGGGGGAPPFPGGPHH